MKDEIQKQIMLIHSDTGVVSVFSKAGETGTRRSLRELSTGVEDFCPKQEGQENMW